MAAEQSQGGEYEETVHGWRETCETEVRQMVADNEDVAMQGGGEAGCSAETPGTLGKREEREVRMDSTGEGGSA